MTLPSLPPLLTLGRVLRLICGLSLALSSCEPYALNEPPNRFPASLDQAPPDRPPNCIGDQCLPSESCESCLMPGTWYRFDTLTIDALDDDPNHPAKGILNNLWSVDIRTLQLNILFEILSVEGRIDGGQQVEIRAMNAAYQGDMIESICLLPETEIGFSLLLEGCAFSPLTAGGINIYAGSAEIPKNCGPEVIVPHTIPVRNVGLEGRFESDCGRLIEGKVPGASLGETELNGICTCLASNAAGLERCGGPDPSYVDPDGLCNGCGERYSSLEEQLATLGGGSLNLSCSVDEGDGPRPAVCIDGAFSAERLDFTPALCPGR